MVTDIVELPTMMRYYIAEKDMIYLEDILKSKKLIVVGNTVSITFPYDNIVFGILKVILDKSEKVTVGNQLKYEYELDMGTNHNAHEFTFRTDTGETIKCTLYSLYRSDDNMIKINFNRLAI